MNGFLAVLRREIARFMKVIVQTIVTPLVSSFLYLLIFGVSLGAQMGATNGVNYLNFLIPGLMMMSLINNSFQNSSSSITTAKFSGDLEDLKVAPLSNFQIISAMSVAALIRGAAVSVITLIVGMCFLYFQTGEVMTVKHPLITLYFVCISGLMFGLIGISVAFFAKSFEQISAFSSFILLPLTYLGGVFLSVEHLHPIWQKISELNPLLYLINGLRYGILGVSDVNIWTATSISLVGFVLFFVLAHWNLSRASFQRW